MNLHTLARYGAAWLRCRKKRYAFVVGCGHSGTTLVTAMLGAHPSIYSIPYETNAFKKQQSNIKASLLLYKGALQCDKPAAELICEKTPKHIHEVERMAAFLPGSKFIICLRDPRDVACSMKRRSGRLESGIRRWHRDNSVAERLFDRGDCLPVYFESLIMDPAKTLEEICNFLGLDYDVQMLDYWQDERDWQKASERRETDGRGLENHKIRRNWQVHQPLMSDRVGVFRRELDAEEIVLVQDRLDELARRVGYVMSQDQANDQRDRFVQKAPL